jgi:hypothetical protein
VADLAALVSALAGCDNRDRTTLERIARALREAGYISVGQQGSDVAERSFREAANLLIGANRADTLKEAGRAVEEYRSLVPGVSLYGDVGEPWSFEPWTFIDEASIFGEALEKLIEYACAILLSRSTYTPDIPGEDAPETRDPMPTDTLITPVLDGAGQRCAGMMPSGAETSYHRPAHSFAPPPFLISHRPGHPALSRERPHSETFP